MIKSGEMDKEKEATQVAEQVNRMEEELTRLSEQIGNLRERLHPVLKEQQLKVGEEKGELSPLVPLADNLREHATRVCISASAITEIIHSLEV